MTTDGNDDTPTNVRRSSRARQTPKLQYEEELKIIAEKKRLSQEEQSSESESESDVEDEMELVDDNDDDDDDNDRDDDSEEFVDPSKAKKTKKASPNKKSPKKGGSSPNKKKKKTTTATTKQRKIQLKIGGGKKKKTTSTKRNKTAAGRRGVHHALKVLANKVLDESETPENSLVAALLASSKPIPGIESVPPRDMDAFLNNNKTTQPSIYTPQLEGIARKLLQDHEPNSMHIQLLSLLFRSVGGSVDTNFKPGTDLEELTDNEWDDLMTEVVEVMREGDDPLLTANAPTTVGPQEYRAIYNEFWYRLGNAVLNHNTSNSMSQDTVEFSSNRFQVEMMRDLISRLAELVLVGQPDLRAASTMGIWQLAISCMERTVELEQKIQVAARQSKASSSSKQNRKLQAVKHSMDAWKRNKAELEEIVESSAFQGVFIHRYRDSNPQIRLESLTTLSKISILRPDLFLRDKYLKYFGWMSSDKEADVRVAALSGLLAPFRQVASAVHKKKATNGPASLQIDLENLRHVCTKFLNRFIDCTEDSQSTQVQELAMELLLAMLQNEFLDDWEDDDGWDQINLKAMDERTTPKVRRDALYFILEQLPSFDPDDDNRSSMSGLVTDKKQVERLEGIAGWVSHKLVDGPVSIDKVKVHLTDLVMQSFRDMPEHKHLVVNWSAMLRAIRSENPQQGRLTGREEVAKQRVLLRMLACAAELEQQQHQQEGDGHKAPVAKGKRKSAMLSSQKNQESLSLEILKSLPHLLSAFKGDILALRSLTQLPRYLMSSVFSLPARKSDFSSLVKNLSQLFLDTTDEIVLSNIARAMATLVEGDHARIAEVRMHVKRLSSNLHDRLMELLGEGDPDATPKAKSPRRPSPRRRRKKSSRGSTDGSTSTVLSNSPEVDVEHSIYLCLLRWRVLLKGCPLSSLFDESSSNSDDGDDQVEGFCTTISEAIGKRLTDRSPILDDGDSNMDGAASTVIPEIWKTDDPAVHAEVARAVDEALQVLLCVAAWKMLDTMKERTTELALAREQGEDAEAALLSEEIEGDELVVVRMRNRLVKLLGMCFDQYLPDSDDVEYTTEQEEFATAVQSSASRYACDTRVLFRRGLLKAKDPVLKALALTNDPELIGGFARYFQSREPELNEVAESGGNGRSNALVNTLLLPFARFLTANWDEGNRQEAGLALSHITGSGFEATQTIFAMARVLKKINPVRFLEAQMSCLRMCFNDWVNNDPDDIGTDRPTEEQLQEYENEIKRHNALFQSIEQKASRLSQCLGVGKLSDNRLRPSMLRFMQEGVRYAFEGASRDANDDLVLGSRLPFLTILSKYANWIKKNKDQMDVLKKFILELEDNLYAHPEFDEVHEDDLAALNSFKTSLGITTTRKTTSYTQDDSTSGDEQTHTLATPSSGGRSAGSKRKLSTAGSKASRYSTQSNLSPLPEEEDASDELSDQEASESHGSPSPQKRRRLHRDQSPEDGDEQMSTVGNVEERIDEGEEGSSDASSAN